MYMWLIQFWFQITLSSPQRFTSPSLALHPGPGSESDPLMSSDKPV